MGKASGKHKHACPRTLYLPGLMLAPLQYGLPHKEVQHNTCVPMHALNRTDISGKDAQCHPHLVPCCAHPGWIGIFKPMATTPPHDSERLRKEAAPMQRSCRRWRDEVCFHKTGLHMGSTPVAQKLPLAPHRSQTQSPASQHLCQDKKCRSCTANDCQIESVGSQLAGSLRDHLA